MIMQINLSNETVNTIRRLVKDRYKKLAEKKSSLIDKQIKAQKNYDYDTFKRVTKNLTEVVNEMNELDDVKMCFADDYS